MCACKVSSSPRVDFSVRVCVCVCPLPTRDSSFGRFWVQLTRMHWTRCTDMIGDGRGRWMFQNVRNVIVNYNFCTCFLLFTGSSTVWNEGTIVNVSRGGWWKSGVNHWRNVPTGTKHDGSSSDRYRRMFLNWTDAVHCVIAVPLSGENESIVKVIDIRAIGSVKVACSRLAPMLRRLQITPDTK